MGIKTRPEIGHVRLERGSYYWIGQGFDTGRPITRMGRMRTLFLFSPEKPRLSVATVGAFLLPVSWSCLHLALEVGQHKRDIIYRFGQVFENWAQCS